MSTAPCARRPMPVRTSAVAVLAAALAFGTSACSDDAETPGASGTAATSSSSGSGDEKASATFADVAALTAAMRRAAEGAGNVKVRTVGTSNSGSQSTGEGAARFGDGFALDVSTGGTIPAVRVVAIGEKVWARPAKKIQGKSWVRLDDASRNNQTAALFGPIAEAMRTVMDVHQTTDVMKHASGFDVLPQETLDGTTYEVYRATLTKQDVLDSMSPDIREQAEKRVIDANSTYTVHVTPDGLPRRVRAESSINGIPSTQETDYTAWGTDASFSTPPAAQVMDLTRP